MARDPESGHGEDQPMGDDRLVSRALRERLGRYPASPRLRAALMQALEPEAARPRWGARWLAPAVSALATAVVMLFWVAGGLPTAVPGDTLRDLTRAVEELGVKGASAFPCGLNPQVAATSLAIIGLANNVNQQNFSGQDLLGVLNSPGPRAGGR
jgi:hypothetical protein